MTAIHTFQGTRRVARVTAISIYPVKGLRVCIVDEAEVEPWGLAGDRRWMVVDGHGRFLTQRQRPAMATLGAVQVDGRLTLSCPDAPSLSIALPDGSEPDCVVTVWDHSVPARPADPAADAYLTAALEQPCRLVYMPDPATARPVDRAYGAADDRVSFADGFPLLVTSEASLDDLNARMDDAIPMSRFRPNIVVEGRPAWEEDTWRQIRVGPVIFEAVKPCARCVVTTIDQITGSKSDRAEPLRSLQAFRRDARGQVLFGQNLIPRGHGRIHVGDPVTLLS